MGGKSPPPLGEVKTMITEGDFAPSGAWAPPLSRIPADGRFLLKSTIPG